MTVDLLNELAEMILDQVKSGLDAGEPISFKEKLAAFKELREHEKWKKELSKDEPENQNIGGISDFKKAIHSENSVGDRNSTADNKGSRSALETLGRKIGESGKSSKNIGQPSTVPNDNAVYSNGIGSFKPAVSRTVGGVRSGTNGNSGTHNS